MCKKQLTECKHSSTRVILRCESGVEHGSFINIFFARTLLSEKCGVTRVGSETRAVFVNMASPVLKILIDSTNAALHTLSWAVAPLA